MFESLNRKVTPRRNRMATLAASLIAHATIIVLLVIAPLLYFTDQLPEPPDMLAFVVASAPPPPPPPPPPAPQTTPAAKPKTPPKPTERRIIPAPVEAPSKIEPERLAEVPVQRFGVEGGVAGGIPGGIVGGLPMMPAPPPPPPPPPPAPKPVRIGGEIQQPTLVHRVNPEYPPIAISARKEGIVILEATVDEQGSVENVRVLRSEPLLDKAAVDAVKQWRYSPLQLNGRTHPFILTVTVSFNL
jgi:periplasmic protein TonB